MMKYACTLKTVNMKNSGPNAFVSQSKTYWSDVVKFIGAAGFSAIEMPFCPYMADPLAFEMGRAGNPISEFAIDSQYGGAEKYVNFLSENGIDEICALHICAQDTFLDIVAKSKDEKELFVEFEDLATVAMEFAKKMGTNTLVLSPSIEVYNVIKYFGSEENYVENMIKTVVNINEKAKAQGITIVVRNEFYGVFRGEKVYELLDAAQVFWSPDTAQLSIAGVDFCTAVKKYGKRIMLPKFCDSDYVDSNSQYSKAHAECPDDFLQRVYCDMGDGTIDFKKCVATLEETGFLGVVVMESAKTSDFYRALLKMSWTTKFGLE